MPMMDKRKKIYGQEYKSGMEETGGVGSKKSDFVD